jgi:hypothetical protein
MPSTLSTSLRIWRLGVRIPRGARETPGQRPATRSLPDERPPICAPTALACRLDAAELSGPTARGWPDGPPGRQQHHRADDRPDDAARPQRQPVPTEQADQQPPTNDPARPTTSSSAQLIGWLRASSRCAIQPANMPHTRMNSRRNSAGRTRLDGRARRREQREQAGMAPAGRDQPAACLRAAPRRPRRRARLMTRLRCRDCRDGL